MITSLKISGYNYSVKYDKDLLRDDNKFGYHLPTKLEICISPDANSQMQDSTLLHEIIEAINYHNELNLNHTQITSLETGLYQVLHDNGIKFN